MRSAVFLPCLTSSMPRKALQSSENAGESMRNVAFDRGFQGPRPLAASKPKVYLKKIGLSRPLRSTRTMRDTGNSSTKPLWRDRRAWPLALEAFRARFQAQMPLGEAIEALKP